MEQNVWSDTEVKRMLTEDVVLISLYVDERTKLPKEQQYETTIAGKKKKVRTVGDKWMVLQAERYKTNSQPYYVVIDHDENQLGVAANYQDYGKVDLFKNWLQDGLNVFNNNEYPSTLVRHSYYYKSVCIMTISYHRLIMQLL